MNQGFYRKVIYLAALVLLLFPMAWLGSPSTREDAGGKLARLRSEAKLGQADLGAIDPASEAFRMATLGARGLAVNLLWHQANKYKKTEDWTAFQATLEQTARLQPYFVRVWQYQAWNLSYNVSVELDDVRDRFYYVKQGIKYLQDGIQYLRDNPTLLDDLGWFCGNKVGRADEHVMYRKMFKADDELHKADVPLVNRDNWLVSREWYELAISSIDDKKQPLGTKNPVTFFDSPARSQMSYAEALQEEDQLRTRWRSAWEEGARLWRAYGTREMQATQGFFIRLADQQRYDDEAAKFVQQLDDLSPGLTAKMRVEAERSLTDRQRKLLAAMPANPTEEEMELQEKANDALNVTPEEVAERIAAEQPDQARAARKLAAQIAEAYERSRAISINRDVANYEYWRIRCDLEQTPEALEARELGHAARRSFEDEGDLERARKLYEESFVLWDRALKKFPELSVDSTMGSDLMDFVDQYAKVLEQLDLSLADKEVADGFALKAVVEANDGERHYVDAIRAWKEQETGIKDDTQPYFEPADGLLN